MLACLEDVTAVVEEYNLKIVNPLHTQPMTVDQPLP